MQTDRQTRHSVEPIGWASHKLPPIVIYDTKDVICIALASYSTIHALGDLSQTIQQSGLHSSNTAGKEIFSPGSIFAAKTIKTKAKLSSLLFFPPQRGVFFGVSPPVRGIRQRDDHSVLVRSNSNRPASIQSSGPARKGQARES